MQKEETRGANGLNQNILAQINERIKYGLFAYLHGGIISCKETEETNFIFTFTATASVMQEETLEKTYAARITGAYSRQNVQNVQSTQSERGKNHNNQMIPAQIDDTQHLNAIQDYIRNPINYIKTRGSSQIFNLQNITVNLIHIAVLTSLQTQQKKMLIDTEMLCRCVSCSPSEIANCIFIANLIHKLIYTPDSYLFLKEIAQESTKIENEYFKVIPHGNKNSSLLPAGVTLDDVMNANTSTNCAKLACLWVIGVLSGVFKKLGQKLGQKTGQTPDKTANLSGEKTENEFERTFLDILLDLRDENAPNYIVSIVSCVATIIMISYLQFNCGVEMVRKFIKFNIGLIGKMSNLNKENYSIAIEWIEGLLFEL